MYLKGLGSFRERIYLIRSKDGAETEALSISRNSKSATHPSRLPYSPARYLVAVAMLISLTACSGGDGGGGSPSNGGGDGGSKWDEMKWDQDNWG